MNSLVFMIIHHSSTPEHSRVLVRCLESIRRIYTSNRILICKTSTSTIEESILQKYKIEVKNTPQDGSTIWGGIYNLIQDGNVDKYILLHDSMGLLKPLPENILDNGFYFLWHFNGYRDNFHESIRTCLDKSRFNDTEKEDIITMYDRFEGWLSCFGPGFGGSIQNLRKLYDVLKLEQNINTYCNPKDIMCAERFISVLVNYMNIFTPVPNSYSLNNDISILHSYYRSDNANMELADILAVPYPGYCYKSWLHRHSPP